jgi:uncharacterized repeat protein (TIGR03803 family)
MKKAMSAKYRGHCGNLYGTTSAGGLSGQGDVYMLSTSGQDTVLYNFTGGADGSQPFAGVIRDSAGNLYGATPRGGCVRRSQWHLNHGAEKNTHET